MANWYRANRPLRIGPGIDRGQVFPARAGANYRALRAMGAVSPVSEEEAAALGGDPEFWTKTLPPKAVAQPAPGEILFTSDAAQAIAEQADLYPEDFDGFTPSGANGTRYTVNDVRAVADAKVAKTTEPAPEAVADAEVAKTTEPAPEDATDA